MLQCQTSEKIGHISPGAKKPTSEALNSTLEFLNYSSEILLLYQMNLFGVAKRFDFGFSCFVASLSMEDRMINESNSVVATWARNGLSETKDELAEIVKQSLTMQIWHYASLSFSMK